MTSALLLRCTFASGDVIVPLKDEVKILLAPNRWSSVVDLSSPSLSPSSRVSLIVAGTTGPSGPGPSGSERPEVEKPSKPLFCLSAFDDLDNL